MKFTGERVIPGECDPDLFNEHMARYLFARRFCAGKRVLDAACGSGYGTGLLGETAASVLGADVDADAVEYARRHYAAPKVRFAQGDCLALPLASEQFDVVVAFEILEHVEDQKGLLNELRRVLHPDGVLLLSTPNRIYYTEERGEVNPFHCRELSFPELEELLQPFFPYRSFLLENHAPAVLLSGAGAQPDLKTLPADSLLWGQRGEAGAGENKESAAHYFVAVCSSRPLEAVPPLLYLPSAGNVLREREIHIGNLKEQVAEIQRQIGHLQAHEAELTRLLEERAEWARNLDRRLSETDATLLRLQADYDAKVQWALSLHDDAEKAREALRKLQEEFEERTAWALQLNGELQQSNQELQNRIDELRLLFNSRWYRVGKRLRVSPIPASDRPKPDGGENPATTP